MVLELLITDENAREYGIREKMRQVKKAGLASGMFLERRFVRL